MEYSVPLCILVILLGWRNGSATSRFYVNEPALWSLRCLHYGPEKCNSSISDSITFSSDDEKSTFPSLEKLFEGMNSTTQEAFIHHNISHLTAQQSCDIPPGLLLLLPAKSLSLMKGSVLGKLLECHSNNSAVVRLISSCIELLIDPHPFYNEVQLMDLNGKVLAIIAQGIKKIESINSTQFLMSRHTYSVLEYLDPKIIISNSDKTLMLWRNVDPILWNQRPQHVKRIWAFTMVSSPQSLSLPEWNDSIVLRLVHILDGATVEELQQLSSSKIQNNRVLLNHPFSLVQIRGLFDIFYRHQVLGYDDYQHIQHLLPRLLPKHLQQFSKESIDFTKHTASGVASLATCRQIIEYIIHSNGSKTITEYASSKEKLLNFDKLLFCIPLHVFANLNYTLSFNDLLTIQHTALSMSQLFFLTNKGTSYTLSIGGIHGALDILKGLPTALLSKTLPPTVYGYLAIEVPGSVPTRVISVLDNLLFPSGTEKSYNALFKNKDAKMYFNFLPSKFIEVNYEIILRAWSHHIQLHPQFMHDIPEHVRSVLLTKAFNRSLTWDTFSKNTNNNVYPLLLRSLMCSDVRNMSPEEFIFVISRFNSLRATYGWVFPKNLQLCSFVKFIKYLEMKSAFMVHYLNTSLAALITPSDVEAVGGFVLTQLPIIEFRRSSEKELIINTIGKTSLPELLNAASLDQLRDIAELYFTPTLGKDLFKLGNLTTFLSADSVSNLDPADFKLMVEAGYLDRRVCIYDSQRDAWGKLIIDAFGPTERWGAQELVTLGDMLIVVPFHELSKIDPRSWAEAADIISPTGYIEMIEWIEKPVPFYEACEHKFKDLYESTTYRRELREYIGWLLTASQYQMESVVNASAMANGMEMHPLSRPKLIEDVNEDNGNATNDQTRRRILPFSSMTGKMSSNFAKKVSCDSIRMVGKAAELFITTTVIDELGDELEDCIEELAKMDLPQEIGLYTWNKLQWKFPHLAGKLLAYAGAMDLNRWELSFQSMWSHEAIYYLTKYNRKEDVNSALLKVVKDQKLSLLSVEQVIALGHLTCKLPDVRMTPTVFFKASRHLGANLPCDVECFQYFQTFFANVDAYGPLHTWTPEDVESLGVLIAGIPLEDWISLMKNNSRILSRIGSRVIQCLPKEHLQALTEEVVIELPALTAEILLERSSFLLNASVKTALENHLAVEVDFKSPEITNIVFIKEDGRYVAKVADSGSSQACYTVELISMLLLIAFYQSLKSLF